MQHPALLTLCLRSHVAALPTLAAPLPNTALPMLSLALTSLLLVMLLLLLLLLLLLPGPEGCSHRRPHIITPARLQASQPEQGHGWTTSCAWTLFATAHCVGYAAHQRVALDWIGGSPLVPEIGLEPVDWRQCPT